MRVVYFHRKPRSAGNYSIEGYFQSIRQKLPKEIEPLVAVSKYESNGIFKRVYNIIEAALRQKLGDVYHITGEVHFLTYLLKKNKTILTILDCVVLERTKGITRWLYKFFWYTIPVKRAKIVTAISESTKKEILKYVKCDPEKVVVVPVFISEKFKPYIKKFNSEKPVLLQVGTAPNKNIPRLIEAIRDIPCKLEIIGQLDEQIMQHLIENKIDYENFVNLSEDELVERYNNCDIITFVSTYEGFGMPIVEANAVGRPVITGNIYSMAEVAGNAACLVDPLDRTAITSGVKRIMHDDRYREQIINKGFENLKRFDINLITGKYYELYRSL